jgi:hypothetical protein
VVNIKYWLAMGALLAVCEICPCAPGYIPTAQAALEGYHDTYSWVAFPECEATMRQALKAALNA